MVEYALFCEQKLKKNNKANVPINKLFEEEKLFEEKFVQSSVPPVAKNMLLTEEALCINNRGRLGSERKV